MPIYDQFGRPIDTSLLRDEQAFPTWGGLRSISGRLYPTIDLTPDKLNAILKLADFGDPLLFLELCEEIEEKDNHYVSLLNKRKTSTASLELIVDAASDDPADIKIADFVRETICDESGLNIRNHLFDILDALGKGFSATEIIWDTEKKIGDDSWWMPVELKARDPRWFMFDWISGESVLVRSLRSEGVLKDLIAEFRNPSKTHLDRASMWNTQMRALGLQPLTEPLAPYKFITHFAKSKSGLPIRSGLTRLVCWTYVFKRFAQSAYAQFTDRFGVPLRIGKYDTGASDADKNALLTALVAFGTDMAGVIPESMSIEFPSPQSLTGNITLFREYVEYLEDLVSKLVVGQTLTSQLPRGGGGSRAAAQVHRGIERELMEGDAKRLEATLNAYLVRPLVDLNYGVPIGGRYPKLRLGLPDDDDSIEWVKAIVSLAASGLEIGEKTIRQKLKLPKPEPGEKILTPPQKATVRTQQPLGDEQEPSDPDDVDDDALLSRLFSQRPRAHTRASVGDSPVKAGDKLAEKLRDAHWKEVMDPMVEPIIKAIRAAHSYSDLQHRLNRIAKDMDPAKFKDLMARALFNAHMAGRKSAEKRK